MIGRLVGWEMGIRAGGRDPQLARASVLLLLSTVWASGSASKEPSSKRGSSGCVGGWPSSGARPVAEAGAMYGAHLVAVQGPVSGASGTAPPGAYTRSTPSPNVAC